MHFTDCLDELQEKMLNLHFYQPLKKETDWICKTWYPHLIFKVLHLLLISTTDSLLRFLTAIILLAHHFQSHYIKKPNGTIQTTGDGYKITEIAATAYSKLNKRKIQSLATKTTANYDAHHRPNPATMKALSYIYIVQTKHHGTFDLGNQYLVLPSPSVITSLKDPLLGIIGNTCSWCGTMTSRR